MDSRAEIGSEAAGPSGLVAVGRPHDARSRRALGRGVIIVGMLWLGMFGGLIGYLTDAFLLSGGPVRLRSAALPLACGSLCILLVLTLNAMFIGVGALHLLDARQLDRIRLAIDAHGITRSDGHRPVKLPWSEIRHVAVTAGRLGDRRLVVDAGNGRETWWYRPPIPPGRVQVRLFSRKRGFAVNVPLDLLTVDGDQIVRAIRRCSGGRFPNR